VASVIAPEDPARAAATLAPQQLKAEHTLE
jgi:hypothetical protein